MSDTTRDKLWADVFTQAHAKGRIWFQCQQEADRAVHCYDKRPAATQAGSASSTPEGEGDKNHGS